MKHLILSYMFIISLFFFISFCGNETNYIQNELNSSSGPVAEHPLNYNAQIKSDHLPPVILSSFQAAVSIEPGGDLLFIVRAVDPEGGALFFDWTSNGGVFDDSVNSENSEYFESLIYWTAPVCGDESFIIQVTISDEGGESTVKEFLPVELIGGVPCSYIYVDIVNGDDSNPGTIDEPLQTVQAGIDFAVNNGANSVFVAEGDYVKAGPVAIMQEGVSLYGGYFNSFSDRDTYNHASRLDNIEESGGHSDDPNSVIFCGWEITAATIIDGFTICAAGGDYSSGIYMNDASPKVWCSKIIGGSGSYACYAVFNINNSSPVLEWNTIIGGDTGNYCYGVYNNNSSPVLNDNNISGGYGGEGACAIYNENFSSPEILGNSLDGGEGSYTYGVMNSNSSSPLIEDNTIYGGLAMNDSRGIGNAAMCSPVILRNSINGGDGSSSAGIINIDSSAFIANNTICAGSSDYDSEGISDNNSISTILNNTIDGGSGTNNTCGIYLYESNNSTVIENNIIFTSGGNNRYGIYESEYAGSSDPGALRNNDIFDCPQGLYFDNGSVSISDINVINNLSDIFAGDNISVDPQFADRINNDLHLGSSSPGSVVYGGLNGTDEGWSFANDKDDADRPSAGNPWSIGAYEY